MKVEHWKVWLLLFAALPVAAPQVFAQGKMFKCVVNGRTTYQQTACAETLPVDEVRSPAEMKVAEGRPTYRQSGPPNTRTATPPDSAASAVNAASAVGNSQSEAESTKVRGKR
jgi:hypothetical protein